LGKLDSAKKSYEEIVKNFPQSADAELAKKQLAKLGQ
jgi:TolA-binding protein